MGSSGCQTEISKACRSLFQDPRVSFENLLVTCCVNSGCMGRAGACVRSRGQVYHLEMSGSWHCGIFWCRVEGKNKTFGCVMFCFNHSWKSTSWRTSMFHFMLCFYCSFLEAAHSSEKKKMKWWRVKSSRVEHLKMKVFPKEHRWIRTRRHVI